MLCCAVVSYVVVAAVATQQLEYLIAEGLETLGVERESAHRHLVALVPVLRAQLQLHLDHHAHHVRMLHEYAVDRLERLRELVLQLLALGHAELGVEELRIFAVVNTFKTISKEMKCSVAGGLRRCLPERFLEVDERLRRVVGDLDPAACAQILPHTKIDSTPFEFAP